MAFTERTVLESIQRAEQQATGAIKRVLGLLRTLYVLSEIDEEPVFLRFVLTAFYHNSLFPDQHLLPKL